MQDPPTFIPPHGNYSELLSYRKAEAIYDATHRFCERFLRRGDRTIDQMIQTARSGKQNIAEGSKASGTSKQAEIKLTNVARELGGTPLRLPRLPPRARPATLGQGLKRGSLRAAARQAAR